VADYRNRISYILNELLTKTNAQIILINLPYLGASDAVPFPLSNVLDMRTKQFNNVIAELGHNDHIKYVDLYSQTRQPFIENPSYYASDHFHPSGEGYLLWGKIINAD
jgi:lysophospholipase L1-like esterase